MFVPEGCVLLTTAVDRLAEARRTAGQANDDGKHAAQLELRGKFYSDTISPLVVSRSGKNYKIRPHRWGSEEALTWFEQGECWLTEYLVDPPLGMFHGKERAYIFVGEHDLQRLMAKQATKQESVPHDPIADVEAREKDEGGRPLQPEGASEMATPKRRGRKKGDGSYAIIDLPLLSEMKELILSHRAASPEEAARMLAEKAFGSGTQESKVERLAKRYRENASGPNSLGSGS